MKKLFYMEDTYEKRIFHILGVRIKFPPKEYYYPKGVNSNIKISVVINTFNAERLLEKAIKSVINADEIVVCDMHSTDRTIEIAKKYNCKIVYHEKMNVVEPARNYAISQTSGDWILILDADEIVPKDLWDYLVSYANNPLPNKFAVTFARKNWFLYDFMEHAGADWQLRFFKKGCIYYETAQVHIPPKTVDTEIFTVPIKIKGKDLVLYHYTIANFSQFLSRQNIYTSEELKKVDFSKIKPSKFKIISIFGKYFKWYVKDLHKDGFQGFVWAIYSVFYEITIYIKSLESKEKYVEKQSVDADMKIK